MTVEVNLFSFWLSRTKNKKAHDRLHGNSPYGKKTEPIRIIYLRATLPYSNVPYMVLYQPCTWHRWTTGGRTRPVAITLLLNAFLSIEVCPIRTWTTLNSCSTTASFVRYRTFVIYFASRRNGNVCFISTTVCAGSATRKLC